MTSPDPLEELDQFVTRGRMWAIAILWALCVLFFIGWAVLKVHALFTVSS